MTENKETYTYRAGRKVLLEKEPDQFVVRALPATLKGMGIEDAEKVSSSSSRVTSKAEELEILMSMMRHLAPTHHSYRVAETGEEFLITDRVMVTFREPLPTVEVDAFAGKYGLIRLRSYSDRDYLFQLTDGTGMNPVKLVVRLMEQEPMVETADHDLNRRMSTYSFSIPTDPAYSSQWHLHTRFIDRNFDPRSSSRCEDAWKILEHFGSGSVVVGVTDDGCKLDHKDFDSPEKFAGWGYLRGMKLIKNINISADPREMYTPGEDHGTACAGVVAAEVDSSLTVGSAPSCRLLPIKWEVDDYGYLLISDDKIYTVLEFVSDKVDVLTNSWGSSPTMDFVPIVIRKISDLAKTGGRRGRGIVFIWAAGNENCPVHHNASMEVPCTDGCEVRPDGSLVWVGVETARRFENDLAGIPGLMIVAAVTSLAQRSHYSNYGTGIDISAPSNNVHTYRRQIVKGLDITTTTGEFIPVTEHFGGTSSAAPLVAGIASLVISANPDLSAREVVSILKQTASKDLDFEGYPRTAPATFDPDTSWDVSPIPPFDRGEFADVGDPDGTWSPWFGHGRIDAAKAVAEALSRRGDGGEKAFKRARAPNIDIPDDDFVGVRDSMTFSEAANLTSIMVSIDISHTFVGDLRLTLIAPSGKFVVVHDRNGGSSNDIRQTFDLKTTPELGSLIGQFIQGDWTLLVQDLGSRDVGRLNRWELEIEGGPTEFVDLEDSPAATVPDNDPRGIMATIKINDPGRVKEVTVFVDITHNFIGDLEVTLISPAGTVVPLHQREGMAADNIIRSYTPATTPDLARLRGEQIEGGWRLNVADLARSDVGKLNRWGLKITKEA
ncbi:proprotein convertase P-domain-containing protein [Methanotrichaceae archaeon M04Ac]|uniref:Proprotein convertase P-domain-containing protein n=1 Tax=Candidatus Methanocrinis alkalitolerans TaxID=3033395 RepID=A0ABT5XHI8_9EURY|nr:proprotein convertase P-domain-containing protein [Candidatus Methanocrinis alkalitolerans]MDF0594179.1 proprotein convertase P-domain-containing protein [Candidatus Methanocrinis alkalitolerans]